MHRGDLKTVQTPALAWRRGLVPAEAIFQTDATPRPKTHLGTSCDWVVIESISSAGCVEHDVKTDWVTRGG